MCPHPARPRLLPPLGGHLPCAKHRLNPLGPPVTKVSCTRTRSPGVAMDDLVYICTKIARQMDAAGLDRMFSAVDAAQAALEGAEPLLQRAMALTEQVCGGFLAGCAHVWNLQGEQRCLVRASCGPVGK